jgi:hypothetical protein
MSDSRLIIIGITGHNESGKDTVATTLTLLGNFFRIGLADSVRGALNDLDGPTWQLRKESGQIPGGVSRDAMKLMGSECRNYVDNQLLWTDLVLAKIRYCNYYHAAPRNRFVIPDVRFPHEVERISSWVASQNGIYETWKLVRLGYEKKSDHDSEILIDSIKEDVLIRNNQDKIHLVSIAEQVMCDRHWHSS